MPTNAAFTLEIKNGLLTLANKDTGESQALEDVKNFKSLTYVELFSSCFSYSIYLLTDDGKIYTTNIGLHEINNVSNINNMFIPIELPIKVKEMGIIKTKDVPATAEEILLKDENDIEYYGYGSKYYKIS